jgi:hypothetical protein
MRSSHTANVVREESENQLGAFDPVWMFDHCWTLSYLFEKITGVQPVAAILWSLLDTS